MAGLEVDSIEDRFSCLKNVVLSRITRVSPHPNADRLKCCQVDIGEHILDIVCGAPNAREGMLTACALPGTRLPSGLVIKKSSIRGQVSEGMLCSASELEFSQEHSGIMDIQPEQVCAECPLGSPLPQALKLSDPVIEIDLTPNRPDCLSFIGIAREISAFQKNRHPVNYPAVILADDPAKQEDIQQLTSVEIQAPKLCPRYAARLIQGITVQPSPFWLQDRLRSIGLKPVNNIVDITNFVMLEMGQPLHAFDFDRLAQNRIVVRTACEGETFVTLDNQSHQLTSDMLMICDGEKPVAIAGVMGGRNSEIEPETVNVLIESACFLPSSIRKTSKKTGIKTDAAFRFERGVDPAGTLQALNRAAALMVKIGEGSLVNGIIDENPIPYQEKKILLDVHTANRKLGTSFTAGQIDQFLNAIEFKTTHLDTDQLRVTVPSFRVDVSIPEDLMEEIARLWGYNNIKTTFPSLSTGTPPPRKFIALRNRIKVLMTGLGFYEAINYSFFHKDSCQKLLLATDDIRCQTIDILNPLSEDQAVMRTSLLPGLLETLKRNLAVRNQSFRMFELGIVFLENPNGLLPEETEMLAGLWTGFRTLPNWSQKTEICDFYDIKGSIEALFEHLGMHDIHFIKPDALEYRYMNSDCSAAIYQNDICIGIIGELHPQVLKNFNIKQNAYIFEINLYKLLPMIPDHRCAAPIPKFPSTSRDMTLIMSKKQESGRIMDYVIKKMESALVECVELLDIYEGDPIPSGMKSVSYRLTYRAKDATLQDQSVNNLHKKITEQLLSEFQATLPS
jgi:phenylalanyl-tRNA synthetase beta chain